MLKLPLHAVLISIVIHALWGGNPAAVKLGMLVFPPYWSAYVRFIIGILTIALWCKIRGLRILPYPEDWRPLFLISLLFTAQIGLMNVGFDQTSGVNAAILIATNPLFAALFAHALINGDRLSGLRTLGLVIGFSGVCLTIIASRNGGGGLQLGSSGDWLCVTSAALLGFRLIVSAKAMQKLDPYRLALWQMIFSLPPFALAGYLFETIHWNEFGLVPMLGLLYQGVVIAGIGFMGSLWLISRYQPSVMVSFNFISPVSGVVISAWLLGDTISWNVLLGSTLLVGGMILVCLKQGSN